MNKPTEHDYLIQSTVESGDVRVWSESIIIPTYEIGEEEKHPMFLERRVYQGSSGVVYPYTVVEKVSDNKVNKIYNALFIENQYIKVMVLPALGGRIQMAYDKVKERHFVYYNQVIKPALVGLTGPWISGGIEFNWPQHHRPSTFMPTDYFIDNHDDGSKTIWCSEVERMFRTKGMQGFTLYPDKAYIEIKVKVYNRTAFPQTFLWWANPAVPANDNYQSVFPPDVHAVFDHGKRDVSSFPIARGIYYKHDYSLGVDISKYKNIPVPTSYMAIHSKYDFIGGYDEGEKGGLLHVANHHLSPGKKQWTWGCGEFGKAWERNLTDENGPYVELMTGVYTDNQPDFSWLQPYEEKSWKQYFMPYAEIGTVKNANKDAAINLELHDEIATVLLYTTSKYKGLNIKLRNKSAEVYLNKVIDCAPQSPFIAEVGVSNSALDELILEVFDVNGSILVGYRPEPKVKKAIPEPAKKPKDPKDISSIEELFLIGHHLEQYRHATYNPLDYYLEALSREETDVRHNNAAGLLYLKRGQFGKARPYLQMAINTLTERNPNPYDGEPYYNLGCCLRMEGKYDEAYNAFYKASWNAAWRSSSCYALALLDCRKKEWSLALEHVNNCLIGNWNHHKARQLKASILRKLTQHKEAISWIEDSLDLDYFNFGCHFEMYLISRDERALEALKTNFRDSPHDHIEYALDFADAGLYIEAIDLLLFFEDHWMNYPMVFYTLGYLFSEDNKPDQALLWFFKAAHQSPDACFPNRIEEVKILKCAIDLNPADSKAYYYLGNFWYAKKQYEEALECWENSIKLDNTFPAAYRNLSIAYYNKQGKKEKAKQMLQKAFALDRKDARIYMELDQLYKKMGYSFAERFDSLEKNLSLVEQRDDLYVEWITLHNHLGMHKKARELISRRKFHPWEGGEGKVAGQYILCRLKLAKMAIVKKEYNEALSYLEETDFFPESLGEGKLATIDENDINYLKGLIYLRLLDADRAKRYFMKATQGEVEPIQAFFYNDTQPDKVFFQGLAWRQLGDESKAKDCFYKLIRHGESHLLDECRIDYFAVSLPDLAIWEEDLTIRNRAHCYYVMALGYSGLGEYSRVVELNQKLEELDINEYMINLGDVQIVNNLCRD